MKLVGWFSHSIKIVTLSKHWYVYLNISYNNNGSNKGVRLGQGHLFIRESWLKAFVKLHTALKNTRLCIWYQLLLQHNKQKFQTRIFYFHFIIHNSFFSQQINKGTDSVHICRNRIVHSDHQITDVHLHSEQCSRQKTTEHVWFCVYVYVYVYK